jgi:hypothetical protein
VWKVESFFGESSFFNLAKKFKIGSDFISELLDMLREQSYTVIVFHLSIIIIVVVVVVVVIIIITTTTTITTTATLSHSFSHLLVM